MPAGTPNDATLNVPYPGGRLGTGLLYFTCGLKVVALGGGESASSSPGTATPRSPISVRRRGVTTYSVVAEVKA